MSLVVFLNGQTEADAVGGIGRAHGEAFRKIGHEFRAINLTDTANAHAQLRELLGANPALVYSFMAIGSDVTAKRGDGQIVSMWEAINVPYISLCGDSPAYMFDRHSFPNAGYAVLYGFPEHLALRRRFGAINGFTDTYAPMALDAAPVAEMDFKTKASGKIIFLKNGNDPDKLRRQWQEILPAHTNIILQEMATELASRLDDPATTQVDDILQNYFRNRGLDISAVPRLRLFLLAHLDDYLRRVKSKLVIEALLDLPIVLHGSNWDHIDFTGKKLTYVKGGHYDESRKLLRECLASIDISPNTRLAPHDRPLRSFGAHSLCLTNEQEFFGFLPHAKDFMFRFDKTSIQACVAAALDNPQRTVDRGVEVVASFGEHYTPQAFAQRLVDMAACMQFNQQPALPPGLPDYVAWPTKV